MNCQLCVQTHTQCRAELCVWQHVVMISFNVASAFAVTSAALVYLEDQSGFISACLCVCVSLTESTTQKTLYISTEDTY